MKPSVSAVARRSRPLLAGLVLLACSRPGAPPLHRETRLLMDTYVTITAAGASRTTSRALAAAFDRMAEINRKFNHLDSTSPVFAFNTRGEPITDPEVVDVIRAAQDISSASGGVFDVTVEPLVRLWGFYGEAPALPEDAAIDSCRRLVGFRKLAVEPGRVTRLDPRVTVDLGGIAKGFALREAAAVLRANGVDSGIIDLGGDVYAIGNKAGKEWRVGVRNPRGPGVVAAAAVTNRAVVTSGDYERFFVGPDSVRYCHIIDPRTGRPARGIASTTIITDDPLAAQGWSKVLFILGPSAAARAESSGITGILVIDDSLRAFAAGRFTGAFDSTALRPARLPQ